MSAQYEFHLLRFTMKTSMICYLELMTLPNFGESFFAALSFMQCGLFFFKFIIVCMMIPPKRDQSLSKAWKKLLYTTKMR